jgi:hypothetical protein
MKGTRVLVVAALLVACGKSSKKQEPEQSFAQGMQLICEAAAAEENQSAHPAERQRAISEWIDGRVKNAEARALFERVGTARPSERMKVIEEGATRAGIARCGLLEAFAPAPGGVIITPVALVVEGEQVASLHDGAVDPADLEGMTIPRLDRLLGVLFTQTKDTTLTVSIAPEVPYATVAAVVQTIARAGGEPVLRSEGVAESVPLLVPKAAAAPDPTALTEPLGMIAVIDQGKLVLFSISGLEGTMAQPKTTIDLAEPEAPARLGKVLGEIVDRRWSGGVARAPEDRRLVVQAEPTTPTRVLMPLLAAARHAPDGRDLFPDVALAVGFE